MYMYMYNRSETALINVCPIVRLYRHSGAMNKSVKLEPVVCTYVTV